MTDLTLTVGPTPDGKEMAIITAGGHPQRPGSGPCTVMTLELLDNIPDRDVHAWFERMKLEKPWETRQ